ncbi:MAG: rhodanese-like domain-containing protein [Mogibacterium sp.]|nr:rhodanese-like domain-containing protein [Mogibacterium sp.]
MGYYEDLPEIDINEKLEDMKLFENAVLVDVREPSEYTEGHIPGAVNLEAKRCNRFFRKQVEAVLPDKTAHIYMYCYSGARSGMAAAFLRQMGYDRAENIGGFESYTGPVEHSEIHL